MSVDSSPSNGGFDPQTVALDDLDPTLAPTVTIEYPTVQLWGVGPKLNLINPDDLPIAEMLKFLGLGDSPLISRMGSADPAEIQRRLELSRFLLENPKIRTWAHGLKIQNKIPTDSQEFIQFHSDSTDHNPYWTQVHELLGLIDTATAVPQAIREYADTLRSSLQLEDLERRTAREITAIVEQAARFQGVVTVSSRDEISTIECRGYRLYSHDLIGIQPPRRLRIDPTDGRLTRWVKSKLITQWERLSGSRRRRAAMRRTITHEAPDCLRKDLRYALYSVAFHGKQANIAQGCCDTICVTFTFDYSGGSTISIHLLDISIHYPGGYTDLTPGIFVKSPVDNRETEALRVKARTILETSISHAQAGKVIQQLAKNLGLDAIYGESDETRSAVGLFKHDLTAPATETQRHYVLRGPETLYLTTRYQAVVAQLREQRAYFSALVGQLSQIAHAVSAIETTAFSLGAPISIPEILPDEHHLIEFEQIWPIHLVGRGEKIVPIANLAKLNGNLLGITGRHGGGKTVTELTIPLMLYLAQSGLPIIGRGFRFNVKEVIGAVFIERGDGSTIQILLRKTANILESIKGIPGNKIVLILDELGSATQEASGLELGRDLLEKLHRDGVSVLFSTQITTLAEYACDELGALCFKVDDRHQIQPGIGTGEMGALRKEMRIDDLLWK